MFYPHLSSRVLQPSAEGVCDYRPRSAEVRSSLLFQVNGLPCAVIVLFNTCLLLAGSVCAPCWLYTFGPSACFFREEEGGGGVGKNRVRPAGLFGCNCLTNVREKGGKCADGGAGAGAGELKCKIDPDQTPPALSDVMSLTSPAPQCWSCQRGGDSVLNAASFPPSITCPSKD